MKLLILSISFFVFLSSCGADFLELASEYGTYSTQQVRDIEEMRRQADDCNYEEQCFRDRLDRFIRTACDREEFNKRGFISQNECERQYPFIFIEVFKQGKYASVDGLQAQEDYKLALKQYQAERSRLDEAAEDYDEAKSEWTRAQRVRDEDDYEDAIEEWEDAQEDYDDAWKDYADAREDYEEALKTYNDFFGF